MLGQIQSTLKKMENFDWANGTGPPEPGFPTGPQGTSPSFPPFFGGTDSAKRCWAKPWRLSWGAQEEGTTAAHGKALSCLHVPWTSPHSSHPQSKNQKKQHPSASHLASKGKDAVLGLFIFIFSNKTKYMLAYLTGELQLGNTKDAVVSPNEKHTLCCDLQAIAVSCHGMPFLGQGFLLFGFTPRCIELLHYNQYPWKEN